jgi:hypothetical protein
MPPKSEPAPPQPLAEAKASVDNRAVQMNPNNATYYQSRGSAPQQASQQARAAAQNRQPVSNR